ncbi:MAG TPA: MauE/DoxX family redox-associated membrane protein [Ferruginibacter sp.]|nr:MauE/DoxX family redox-associated membrane protein [Ferruginibacter sp.]
MTHTYNISGMTCNGCVATVKDQLLKIPFITAAMVQLTPPQASLRMQKHIPIKEIQQALLEAGSYKITEADTGMYNYKIKRLEAPSWFTTYRPVLTIAAYLLGITLLIEIPDAFHTDRWMANFMAGFFLVFSFFKLLNLDGFAESYATYDVIAKKLYMWGYMYAFIELGLGISYLLRWNPLITNTITFIIMNISLAGVLQSVLGKKKIQCACLGAVFNLPMSTVTIIEDAIMIGMSFVMLFMML